MLNSVQGGKIAGTDDSVTYEEDFSDKACTLIKQLERQLIWAEEVMAAVETSEKCPNCDDVGWFVEWRLRSPGAEPEPEQCQCEFCETNPKSRFKALTALNEYKQGTKSHD